MIAPDEPGWTRLATLAVLALAVATFAQTVGFGFVYDDFWTVADNAFLGRPRDFGALLDGSAWRAGVPDAARPLAVLSFALDRALYGSFAGGYHATNVALHAACSAMVLRLARALGLPIACALLAGALFAVHPVHVEAVAVVSYREDLLACLLALIALDGVLGKRAVQATIAAFLAPLAKENAFALPLVIALLPTLFPERRPGRAALVGPLLASAAALALRLCTVGFSTYPGVRESLLLQAPRAIVTAFAQSLVPFGLGPVHAAPAGMTLALGGAALLGALLGLAITLRRREPLLAFGFACFTLFMLPTSNLFAMPVASADRFAYLPSVGTALLVGALAARLRSGHVVLAIATLALGAGSAFESRVYRNEATLWQTAARRAPDQARAQAGLAHVLRLRGDLDGARAAVERARALDARDPAVHVVAGALAATLGHHEEALSSFDRALALGAVPPAQLLRNRAASLDALGRHDQARRERASCAARFPFDGCDEEEMRRGGKE